MPMSEAWRDAPVALRRVRFAGFNDSVGGVVFVGGAAQAGMPASVAARLRSIGLPIEDIGEWSDLPTPEAPSPVLEPPPSADAGDVAPLSLDSDASVAPESLPADAPEEPTAPDSAPAKSRKPTR